MHADGPRIDMVLLDDSCRDLKCMEIHLKECDSVE